MHHHVHAVRFVALAEQALATRERPPRGGGRQPGERGLVQRLEERQRGEKGLRPDLAAGHVGFSLPR